MSEKKIIDVHTEESIYNGVVAKATLASGQEAFVIILPMEMMKDNEEKSGVSQKTGKAYTIGACKSAFLGDKSTEGYYRHRLFGGQVELKLDMVVYNDTKEAPQRPTVKW